LFFFLFDISFWLSRYLQPVVVSAIAPQTTNVIMLKVPPLCISRPP
jgi:hypothetical protein